MRALIPLAAASMLLAACGQKGPLYLPDEEPDRDASASAPTAGPEVNA